MKNQLINKSTLLSRKKEQGVVLIAGLIFLLVLSFIALSSIGSSEVQERMAGNMRDRNIAFQAAEAALRAAEEFLDQNEETYFDGSVIGYWPDLNIVTNRTDLKDGNLMDVQGSPALWTDAQWTSYSTSLTAGAIQQVSQQPRYVIEQILVADTAANQGSGVDVDSLEKMAAANYFRVTARGYGLSDTANVTLQSTYVP